VHDLISREHLITPALVKGLKAHMRASKNQHTINAIALLRVDRENPTRFWPACRLLLEAKTRPIRCSPIWCHLEFHISRLDENRNAFVPRGRL
jgi:hypothetical protein